MWKRIIAAMPISAELVSPALAICQEDRGRSYSLCYCNEDWRVLAASSHRSVEDARQEAEFENDGVVPNWQSPVAE